jgi:hypothetical protein
MRIGPDVEDAQSLRLRRVCAPSEEAHTPLEREDREAEAREQQRPRVQERLRRPAALRIESVAQQELAGMQVFRQMCPQRVADHGTHRDFARRRLTLRIAGALGLTHNPSTPDR